MNFEKYQDDYLDDCLRLFDKNCPQFFAANEREDYKDYLQNNTDTYQIKYLDKEIVAAFGLAVDPFRIRGRITWIMVCPDVKGKGIGTEMMEHALRLARKGGVQIIDIAASHLSAPFFEKFGAVTIKTIENGWGDGMHRLDMEMGI